MSHRGHERMFDWDEARRLSDEGMSHKLIAARLGVSYSAVYRVLAPGAREKMNARAAAWVMGGTCPDCGKAGVSRTALDKPRRCVECAQKAQATSVHDSELLCFVCRRWKPDSEFPRSRSASKLRRARHNYCRGCQAPMRRQSRERARARKAAA